MSCDVTKFLGRVVEMIYVDRCGRISKRTAALYSVKNGMVRAYCFYRMAPRVFRLENILAVEPKGKRAV